MDTAILGWLVENATKQRLASYMERTLWKPAGMHADAIWSLDGPPEIGREMAGGAFAATLRDYGRFALLMLNNGTMDGKRLLSSEWIKSASTADRTPVRHGNLGPGDPFGYGYQWWLTDKGDYLAVGVHGQMIFISPKSNVAIVKISHWPKPWIQDMAIECYTFFDAVTQTLASERTK